MNHPAEPRPEPSRDDDPHPESSDEADPTGQDDGADTGPAEAPTAPGATGEPADQHPHGYEPL